MKRLFSVMGLLALSACSTITPENVSPCVSLQLECSGPDNILIVGKAEYQTDLINAALTASKTFQDIFKRAPAKSVIFMGGTITAEQRTAFKEAGYPVALPWLSAADKAQLAESSIRRQVESQTEGFPESIKKAMLDKALLALNTGETDKQSNEIQAGALAHELGHLWFIDAFKPEGEIAQTGHAYGGWAPDWLDESAAVLLENATLKTNQRAAFKALSSEEILPLSEFLSMEHPAANSTKDLRKSIPTIKNEGETRTIVLSGKEAEEFLKKGGGDKVANFYAQVQAFSDFLMSKSGDKTIYLSLTEDLLAGNTFEQWLSRKGELWKLPTTLQGLESAWQEWIQY